MDTPFGLIGTVGILLVVLAACIAIWKWGSRYKTPAARVAAVLMIVGLCWGIGVRGGLILFFVGLVVMFVVRHRFLSKQKANAPTLP